MRRKAEGLLLILSLTLLPVVPVWAKLLLNLGSRQAVQAGNPPSDIAVLSYSIPSYVDWNNDGKKDLVVGGNHVVILEGGGIVEYGKVRVYLNEGTVGEPAFDDYFFVQSGASDLLCPASACLSCFPRVTYWDGDANKDLLIGLSDGRVRIYINIGSDIAPTFDGGSYLMVGQAGSKIDICVLARATPVVVDWNNDGKKDLAVGAYDGKIHLFINEGTDTEPDFIEETFAQEGSSNLVVPTLRSSPHIIDLDGDGKKDILTGDTEGQLLFYKNVGTDSSPNFSGFSYVESDGVAINFDGQPRTRPFVCDWRGNNYFDVLVGVSDGKVYLYEGRITLGDFEPDGDVDMADFCVLSEYWLETSCGECDGVDLTDDGNVDIDDIGVFAENWLYKSQ